MNINSNGYTFAFASGMVIIVAAILSVAATSLKSKQDANVVLEKKQSILSSIGVAVERDEAGAAYEEYIQSEVVLQKGMVVDSAKECAFVLDLAEELKKSAEERRYPLFKALVEGKSFYIVPMRGKGLWGPIWGYMALASDGNTVYGATFDHKSETPGLGAEISTVAWQAQFPEKKVYSGESVALTVQKPGKGTGEYVVDGISGGTITSNGVDAMLKDCLSAYHAYFMTSAAPKSAPVVDTVRTAIDSATVAAIQF
ncbi:NADH:ubiquinone reductase (Na(+)-transporting) subunit C [bacterium]|nr:NADH:ubiquinone reductase (Na(+)-transporting) subunit C [bacterium]